MENGKKKREERKLTEAVLKLNGIEFDEKVERDKQGINEYFLREGSHSQQAWVVTEGLLDFDGILSPSNFALLPAKSRAIIDEKFETCKFRGPTKHERKSPEQMDQYSKRFRVAPHDKRFKLAFSIRNSARNVKATKETRWSAIVKNELFGNLIQFARQAEGMTFFDPMQIVERVRVEDEDTWKRGHTALRRSTPHSAPLLTAPKADLYVALPMVTRTSNSRGFHQDDYIQNFQADKLSMLEETQNGRLIANPLRKMDTTSNEDDLDDKGIDEKYLVCFPSTVVELKHHGVKAAEVRRCYCQAANAASTALSMINRASRYSIPTESFGEIRPVIAFTFIGDLAKVWIAFISGKATEQIPSEAYNKKGRKLLRRNICNYKMKCIWKGSLLKTWDNVQLCRIIENLHYWIVRHFRPWISSCIDRWRVVAELKRSKRATVSESETTDSETERVREAKRKEEKKSAKREKENPFDSASEEPWSSEDEEDELTSPECSDESDEEYEQDSENDYDPSSAEDDFIVADSEDSDGDVDYADNNEDNWSFSKRQTPEIKLPSRRKSPQPAQTPPHTKRPVGRPKLPTHAESSPTPLERRRNAATASPELRPRTRSQLHPNDMSPHSERHLRSRSIG